MFRKALIVLSLVAFQVMVVAGAALAKGVIVSGGTPSLSPIPFYPL